MDRYRLFSLIIILALFFSATSIMAQEGITRNRSHFPEHPELFQPMPIPTPTKKLRKPSNDNPEVPESHIIKNGKALSSEKVNE